MPCDDVSLLLIFLPERTRKESVHADSESRSDGYHKRLNREGEGQRSGTRDVVILRYEYRVNYVIKCLDKH